MNNPICFTFPPLTREEAITTQSWRYPPPYDVYNSATLGVEEDLAQKIAPFFSEDSPHFAIHTEESRFIGYIATGTEARVPGGDYSKPALDLGISLHPDWTGRRFGPTILSAFIADRLQDAPVIRATIAAFNQRSLRAFTSVGFVESGRFVTGNDVPRAWILVTKRR